MTNQQAEQLAGQWHEIRGVLTGNHYLRLPAERLWDGKGRERPVDAVIDYAIGLESLLLHGIRDELSYRFALRGATLLTHQGGDKEMEFRRLREFYEARSGIVHASDSVSRVREIAASGEDMLRNIWWWFFERRKSGIAAAISEIDKRILSSR